MQLNRMAMAVLVEQDVHTYSPVYNYPQTALWRELDLTGAQADNYNRYGFADFQLRRGPTQFLGHLLDHYTIAIDGCAPFVQQRVKHIVAERPVDTRLRAPAPDRGRGHQDVLRLRRDPAECGPTARPLTPAQLRGDRRGKGRPAPDAVRQFIRPLIQRRGAAHHRRPACRLI